MLRKKLVELHTCRRYARHATARQQSLDLALQDKQIVLIISPTISYLSHIPVTKHIEAKLMESLIVCFSRGDYYMYTKRKCK